MIKLLLWAFMAYGMTTILVYGSIFDKPRNWVKDHSDFFGSLIGCMLCTSTWVGFFMSLVLGGFTSTVFTTPHWLVGTFFDGMATAGLVWAINGFIEFFEESRIN